MNDLTVDWNDPAYANSTVFVDKRGGNFVVIPDNEPDKVRSMMDSVYAGDYVVLPKVPATLTPDSPGGHETLP